MRRGKPCRDAPDTGAPAWASRSGPRCHFPPAQPPTRLREGEELRRHRPVFPMVAVAASPLSSACNRMTKAGLVGLTERIAGRRMNRLRNVLLEVLELPAKLFDVGLNVRT